MTVVGSGQACGTEWYGCGTEWFPWHCGCNRTCWNIITISALIVNQGCLYGPKTPIPARKRSGLAKISAIQGVAPLSLLMKHGGGSHSKSTSQACEAERFRPLPSIKGVQTDFHGTPPDKDFPLAPSPSDSHGWSGYRFSIGTIALEFPWLNPTRISHGRHLPRISLATFSQHQGWFLFRCAFPDFVVLWI